jgi:hypothetical protein
MRNIACNSLQLSLVLLLLLPIPARAIPAVTCHCFTERSYDTARPAAADPYVLATTQNSFFAVVFNTDKKNIVIKKQQGTSSDDLWIAYWIAARSAMSPDTLLQAKLKHEYWKDTLASLKLTTKGSGVRFSSALNATSSSARLADTVVDELLLHYRMLTDSELSSVRTAGASNQELIVTAVLAAKTKQSARQIFRDVKSGSKTWGALLLWANLDTKNMQQEIVSILKTSHNKS